MNLLNPLLIFGLILSLSSTPANAQNVIIPDANFKAYLVGNTLINTNGDGEIQVSEATAFSGGIYCTGLTITNLTGIEAFTSLTELYSNDNPLTSLDVSQNTNLTILYCKNTQLTNLDLSQNSSLINLVCNNNQLTNLDVGQNTNLTSLLCDNNPLTDLDLSQNSSLTDLECNNTQLTSLNLSQNSSLMHLYCYNTQLASLDLSQNTNLTTLYCKNTQLTALDLSQNVNLTTLVCNNNQLTNIDLSQNAALTTLVCNNNQLTSLNLSQNTDLTTLYCQNNQLTALNAKNGNNPNFSLFYALNNPNLACIEVDDIAYSTANWTSIDQTVTFGTDCSAFNSINTLNSLPNVNAYPNPTSKMLKIDLGNIYQEANIQISNVTGQTILNKNLENVSDVTLELEGIAGMYFVKIQTEKGQQILKVIKQ